MKARAAQHRDALRDRIVGAEGAERAIERDADAVLANIANVTDTTLVVGVSLGALPALALDRRLADRPHRLLLLEPLLAYRPPATRVADAAYTDYQTASEAAMLGLADPASIARFAAYLQQLQQERADTPVMLAFGASDRISMRSDWRRPPRPQDRLLVVPGDHAFAPFDPDIWAMARDWLTPADSTGRRPHE